MGQKKSEWVLNTMSGDKHSSTRDYKFLKSRFRVVYVSLAVGLACFIALLIALS